MKLNLLIGITLLVAATGCSTAYRGGQTPDDVYFSPGTQQDEYVQVDDRDDRSYGSDDYYEDRYLRMRVNNRSQWGVLDDYYFYNPYAYNYYGGAFVGGWNSPWNNYHLWNNFYNPYSGFYGGGFGFGGGFYNPGFYGGGFYGGGFGNGFYGPGYGGHIVVTQPRYRTPNRPLSFNSNSYNVNPRANNARNSSRSYINNNNGARYNNNNNYNNSSNSGRYNGNRNSNSGRSNNTYQPSERSTPTRSYNPPASSGSSNSGRSSGSSSGSGSSRPPR